MTKKKARRSYYKKTKIRASPKRKKLLLENDDSEKIAYLEGLVSKQLNLYSWCEEKVSTLATIDSILIGAATLFIEKVMVVSQEASWIDKAINFIIIAWVLFPLFVSLAIALWHIRPKMGSASNTGRPNHRSSNGIRHFQNSNAYDESIRELTNTEICEDFTKQIYGMNNIIWKNQQSIKKAVIFDLIGLVGFAIMIVYWAIF